jgi:aminopeptidase N
LLQFSGARLDKDKARTTPEDIMEQRLRLVQSSQTRSDKRSAERRPLRLPAQIVWKDARGTTRMAAVMTRDISEQGVSVETQGGTPIPLFRMVYFQIDRDVRHRTDLPAALRKTNVLSAIFRVGACSQSTGAPTEYALRLLVEP